MQRLALLVDLVWWSNDANNPLDWGPPGDFLKKVRAARPIGAPQSLPQRSRPSPDPARRRTGRGRGGAGRHHRPGRPDLVGGPSLTLLRPSDWPCPPDPAGQPFFRSQIGLPAAASGQASQIWWATAAHVRDDTTPRHG
jgi:hypothetical protein